jgi:Ca2+-binding RTX toxin-like protein
MKPYINFLILIVAAAALYTAYGILTFTADEPRQFTFNEPKVPANLILMDEEKAKTPEGKLKQVAIDDAQRALDYYSSMRSKAPQQANDTITLLVSRMTSSHLPFYFLSTNTKKGELRSFGTLKIGTDSVIDPSTADKKISLDCATKTPIASIVMGTDQKDSISCDVTRNISINSPDYDVFLMGGPENDQIIDSTGNRIVNGGTGNDIIRLGAGRTIIVLDASWGNDTLTVDCSGTMVDPSEVPKDFSIPWVGKTTNFIVLGDSINPTDLEWKGNVLAHKITGDTLVVNDKCFTVVPNIPNP